MPSTGGTPTNITDTGANIDEGDPDWSPDGTKIAYATWVWREDWGVDPSSGVYVVGANGGSPTQLASYWAGSPAWSPDGTKIAYLYAGTDGWPASDIDIYTLPTSGGGTPTNITNGEWNDEWLSGLDWQPLPVATVPTSKAQCKQGGYKDFDFKN